MSRMVIDSWFRQMAHSRDSLMKLADLVDDPEMRKRYQQDAAILQAGIDVMRQAESRVAEAAGA